jgi:hypothetical protein
MSLRITASMITSDITTHTARAAAPPKTELRWAVSWLASRLVSHHQAITAMTLAEMVAIHAGNLDEDGAWRVHVDQWAAVLGLRGPQVIAAVTAPPQWQAEAYGPDGDPVWKQQQPNGYTSGSCVTGNLDETWADVARNSRAALALLGWPIEPLCLPDELDACGGTFSQHAASHLAVLAAIAAHQLSHLGPAFDAMAAEIYDHSIADLKAGH